ncbi:MAG: NADH-quinone oxidoreductase subunit H [Thermaerobacter sp.]|nr:NADH-quinone oxidoreductase subunit H [Thermaerobacter sp.]
MEYLVQLCQMGFVLLFAPLLRGIMERYRARLAGRHGPQIWQPYRDLRKWWGKDTLRTNQASWVSEWTAVAYFAAPLVVAMLIPVLTAFPLPFAWMGDMLAGGMILGAAGFALLLAALDSGSVYPALGVSRLRLIGAFTEPLAVMLVFTAAAAARATIPFVVNQALVSSRWLWSPTHVLLTVAWFLFLIAETGRIPVDNPSSTQELSMIDPSRTFESSGRDLALYEWGGWMKLLVLLIILMNVLTTPWGLAPRIGLVAVGTAVLAVALKVTLAALLLVTVEMSFAKLRLIRNVDFLVAAMVVAALGSIGAMLL